MKFINTSPASIFSRISGFTVKSSLLMAAMGASSFNTALATPTPNQVNTCVFNSWETDDGQPNNVPTAIYYLQQDLIQAGIGSQANPPRIDYVMVYSVRNDNSGQVTDSTNTAFTGPANTSFTGPILCTNSNSNSPLTPTVQVSTTSENTAIGSLASPVDIDALMQTLITQYKNTGSSASTRQNRVCQTVAGNTQCFLITPVP